MHVSERDVLLATVVAQSPCRLRLKTEKRSDRTGGRAASAELQHLPEKNQRDDDRRRLEVDGRRTVVAHVLRERIRKNDREHAEAERRRCAQRDQREHVQAAVDDGLPASHEEWPAAPQHDRRREQELTP